MKDNTTELAKRSHDVHVLSRRLIPICWSIIFLIAVAMVVALNKLIESSFIPGFTQKKLIIMFGLPGLIWIGLLSFMVRFFSCCSLYGVFSTAAISSIRWIGGIILTSAAIKLANAGYQTVVTGFHAFYTFSLVPELTNMILGIFLISLGRIMAIGNGMEKDAELTV